MLAVVGDHLLQRCERPTWVAGGGAGQDMVDLGAGGHLQHRGGGGGVDRPGGGQGLEPTQAGQGAPDPELGVGGVEDHREHLRVDVEALLFADTLEVGEQLVVGGCRQAQLQAPAAQGGRHLVDLGGRQHEAHVLGRFLEQLEEGIHTGP